MHLVPWLALVIGLVACKDAPQKPTAAAAPPAGSASSAAVVAAPAAPSAPAGSGAATPPTVGCEGWRARKVEHMGMGEMSETVECANGKITRTSGVQEPRGDAEESKATLTRAEWEQLWRDLDAAGWRTLADACPPPAKPPESFGVTELELEITDGKTTKKITCEGANVTAAHEKIMAALAAE